MTPTPGSAAPNNSGRCVSAAPTEQSAVAAPEDRQALGVGVLLADQVLGSRDEIVEDILLLELGAGLVPFLAVFTAAAQVGDGVGAAHLQPRLNRGAESRRQRDVEAAVAVQHHRLVAVARRILAADDEHGHARAVLGVVEHLFGHERREIGGHRGLAEFVDRVRPRRRGAGCWSAPGIPRTRRMLPGYRPRPGNPRRCPGRVV